MLSDSYSYPMQHRSWICCSNCKDVLIMLCMIRTLHSINFRLLLILIMYCTRCIYQHKLQTAWIDCRTQLRKATQLDVVAKKVQCVCLDKNMQHIL